MENDIVQQDIGHCVPAPRLQIAALRCEDQNALERL
jgi:hypothetical protein